VKKKSEFCKIKEMEEFSSIKKLEPEDFYHSPEGYIVFTEKYHLKRGYCCKNGCRHCPYGFSFRSKNESNNGNNCK
jgi:hypothetical protein